ncbi:MAG: hypothetical protein ACLP22_12075 [Solirubrobacteraceae bacterium]
MAPDGAFEASAALIDLADVRFRHADFTGRASSALPARMRWSSCFTSLTSITDLT